MHEYEIPGWLHSLIYTAQFISGFFLVISILDTSGFTRHDINVLLIVFFGAMFLLFITEPSAKAKKKMKERGELEKTRKFWNP